MKKPRKTKKRPDVLFQSLEQLQLRVIELAFARAMFHMQRLIRS